MYAAECQLKQKFEIPKIDQFYGLVAIDDNFGKIALVDGDNETVHFVQYNYACAPCFKPHQHDLAKQTDCP